MMRLQPASTSLVTLLSLLGAGMIFTSQANAASTPVADVYVQTNAGVNVYTANAAGQLMLLPGSPFADAGQMEAVRGGNSLISVGTDFLHVYKIESNGGVGPQVSQIDTQSYGGSQCGTTDGLAGNILDHTGQYFSVQLYGAVDSQGNSVCSAYQTYKLDSNGDFTYLGAAVNSTIGYRYPASLSISTYSSNDLFAYGAGQNNPYASQFYAFKRAAAGDLVENSSFTEKDPTSNPNSGSNYFPLFVAADGASHLAVVMNLPFSSNSNVFQLASYTINNSTGAIQSTNTYANMPKLQVYAGEMAMSWTGNLVAVGSGTGFQVFHFNGAAPPTTDGGVLLPGVAVNQVAWDKNNHLYALSYSTGELHVFTATSSGMREVSGSPYKAAGAYGVTGIVVVPE